MPDAQAGATPFRSGYVAVVGAPNVGKSTLVNHFVGQKLSIVTSKPQTTRHGIMGIVTEPGYQIVFVDTPGLHRPRTALGEYMVEQVSDALADSDAVLWLIDATREPNADDWRTAEALKRLSSVPVALVLNKIDGLSPAVVIARQRSYGDIAALVEVRFGISACTGEGADQLLEWVVEQLPEGPQYYPEDQVTDRQLRFLVAELVREQVLEALRDEVPHAIAVQIDEFTERAEGKTYIAATLFVEKESQKKIVIGSGGSSLRTISMAAREKAEELIEAPVYLDLWVKVRPNWRSDAKHLQELRFAPQRDKDS